jgi:protein involved in polysaccharide export with SLBB domain
LVVGLGLAFPASAQTSPYQLVAGDVVEIVYAGAVEPMSAMVDIDGNIRLPGLRGVAIAGQTLDEAELFLEQSLSDAGLYVDPRISISIARYAQIIVVGDVSNQGFHDFFRRWDSPPC